MTPMFLSKFKLASCLMIIFQACAGHAASELHCQVSYADIDVFLTAKAVDNPYTVAPVDVAGRFLIKPVLVQSAQTAGYVAIYIYDQSRPQPMLIQEAKYLGPFDLSGASLTGEQHLYAGPLERELIYNCHLSKAIP